MKGVAHYFRSGGGNAADQAELSALPPTNKPAFAALPAVCPIQPRWTVLGGMRAGYEPQQGVLWRRWESPSTVSGPSRGDPLQPRN